MLLLLLLLLLGVIGNVCVTNPCISNLRKNQPRANIVSMHAQLHL